MMPAQEARVYAAQHGFTIETDGRRYRILHGDNAFATVSGYPAVLNAMKRYMQIQAESALCRILPPTVRWFTLRTNVIRGNWHVRIEYAQPDQNGDSVFHASRETRSDAIKFVRQHLSSAQGRHVISQSVTYGA